MAYELQHRVGLSHFFGLAQRDVILNDNSETWREKKERGPRQLILHISNVYFKSKAIIVQATRNGGDTIVSSLRVRGGSHECRVDGVPVGDLKALSESVDNVERPVGSGGSNISVCESGGSRNCSPS
jgi:hypothetical protein